jgi:hypothetical protein
MMGMDSGGKVLYVIIGCDTDPDRPGFVEKATEEGKSWRGVTEGISLLKEITHDIKDGDGVVPRITWLIRADEQIKLLYGDYAWALRNFENLLKDLQSDGDELGWHPHFYKFDPALKRWYQEVFEIDWQIQILDEAFRAYTALFPGFPLSVRMGWDYHNNSTLQKLADLGVKVDFSALPGLRTAAPSRDARPFNVYDWHLSPKEPYYPSLENYQRKARADDNRLPILEVPIFTSGSLLWGMIGGLQMARKMRDIGQLFQAMRCPSFLINITGRPKLFAPLAAELDRKLRNSSGPVILATYFHADELLDNKSSLYSRFNMRANLETLLRIGDNRSVKVKFIRACKAIDYFG